VTSSALSVEAADPADFARIAELTVGVYTDEHLAEPGYVPQLADVAGRAERAELLVARDGSGTVVGSVALVLAGAFGEVTESADEAAFRMLVVDRRVRGQASARRWCAAASTGRARPASGAWCSPPTPG
jgi:hypothetical protein